VQSIVVINVVGLTSELVGPGMPRVAEFARRGATAPIGSVIPAVTCSVQSTYLTGRWPSEHGIVGNGWYFRDECEVRFWRQSNRLVNGDKLWDEAKRRDGRFTCANLFWWYNMYSTVDVSVTPRPMYPSDGRKIPDVHTYPAVLRNDLQRDLGTFPLFQFWGPATNIASSQWIADASMHVIGRYNPTMTLVYLPHLDYCLQRFGPDPIANAAELRAIDQVVGALIDFCSARGATVVLLSEYGITAVSRPIHLNRALRQAGLLSVREELGRELLDAGASLAFAVADHQLAHIYVNDPSALHAVRGLIENTPGVARVYDQATAPEIHLNHPRAGELIALAEPDAWFTYYYWLDESRQPDFAPTVDIHRKPGYDPAELFLNPRLKFPRLKIAGKLLRKKLGLRTLMDVVPTSGELVRGSHGLPAASPLHAPVFISPRHDLVTGQLLQPVAIRQLLLEHLFTPSKP
jgi:predicted AlkP superfamily pyrophosphatase or phosphodiesterase